jgi:hypothetical protein
VIYAVYIGLCISFEVAARASFGVIAPFSSAAKKDAARRHVAVSTMMDSWPYRVYGTLVFGASIAAFFVCGTMALRAAWPLILQIHFFGGDVVGAMVFVFASCAGATLVLLPLPLAWAVCERFF